MREYTLYIWLGVWLLALASSSFGVPGNWKDTLLILTALFIITHSFVGYRRARKKERADASVPDVPGEGKETNQH